MHTLTELFGEPGTGKTHQAHAGWPSPYHLDTAYVQMGFRSIDVDDAGSQGESWPVVANLHDWDDTAIHDHYEYVTTFDEVSDAVGSLGPSSNQTVVLDNASDLRALAAQKWCEVNGEEWPPREKWGEINSMVDELIQTANSSHHVVVISQMKAEYVNGESTGGRVRDGPKRLPFRCDFRIQLDVDDDGRHAYVKKNRFVDAASDDFGSQGSDIGPSFTLDELLTYSGVPEEHWGF